MSDVPLSLNPRRSKRKAAIDAAERIKKIVDDASFQEHKNDVRAEKTVDTKTDAASTSSQHSFPLSLPSPYMSVSDGLHSFPSMTSVPEEICMTHSSFLGSYRSPSSQNEDLSDFSNKQTVRECCRRRELNICGGQSNHDSRGEFDDDHNRHERSGIYGDGDQSSNGKDEICRECRRRRRLVNSNGSMRLSNLTIYRMSCFSPLKSPLHSTKLSFTPFARFPTTPMHLYQYRAPVFATSRATNGGRQNSSGVTRRIRKFACGKDGIIKPRKLI